MQTAPKHDSLTVLTRAAPAVDARIRYGNDPNQFADVRWPSGAPKGAVIFVHGGFWRARYDLSHAGHLCAALTKRGAVTWNVEYRRVGNPGGGWPGSFEDVTAALLRLRQGAAEFKFDVERVAVVGHSAGGQLALCLAAHNPWLRGAVSLAGVLDLRRAHELKLSNDAAAEFLGGTPEQVPEHYREASPFEVAISVPQAIVHGKRDGIVPLEMGRQYFERKRKAKEKIVLLTPDADHFDVIDPLSDVWPQVEHAILDRLL